MNVILCAALAALFVTPAAERPDEPVASGAMPSDWVEYPFVETNPKPVPSAAEDAQGGVVFSCPITEPVYRETAYQDRTEAFRRTGI